jgi:hypothetical protein
MENIKEDEMWSLKMQGRGTEEKIRTSLVCKIEVPMIKSVICEAKRTKQNRRWLQMALLPLTKSRI